MSRALPEQPKPSVRPPMPPWRSKNRLRAARKRTMREPVREHRWMVRRPAAARRLPPPAKQVARRMFPAAKQLRQGSAAEPSQAVPAEFPKLPAGQQPERPAELELRPERKAPVRQQQTRRKQPRGPESQPKRKP